MSELIQLGEVAISVTRNDIEHYGRPAGDTLGGGSRLCGV